MEGEGCDRGRSRETSSVGSGTEPGGDESDSSGEGVEMVSSKIDDTGRENAPLGSGRAASITSSVGSSVHSGGSFNSKGQGPYGKRLADALAISNKFPYGQHFTALRAE